MSPVRKVVDILSKYRWLFVSSGIVLLTMNFVGVLKTTRLADLEKVTATRFQNDILLSRAEFEQQLKGREGENDRVYLNRLVDVVANGLLHIKTDDQKELDGFFRIKPTDNWIIFLLSYIYPSYWRVYHYMKPERTIARGVGYCGDAAIVASWALEKRGISPRLAAFDRGHVIAEIVLPSDSNSTQLDTIFVDADFGMIISGSIEKIHRDTNLVRKAYLDAGYTQADADQLIYNYIGTFRYYKNYIDFSPRKLMLENLLYILKWLIPLFLILVPFVVMKRSRLFRLPSV